MKAQILAAIAVSSAVLLTPPGGTPVSTEATRSPVAGPCQSGVWDLTTFDTGQPERKATSTHYCFFDGFLDVAEYRALAPTGQVVFAGVSFHAWQPDATHLTTLWLMVGDPGFTILPATRGPDGRLTADGWGEDAQGAFLERSVTTVSSNHDYAFVMERSRDDGKTWQPQTRIEGVFKTATPPPHATALRQGVLRLRGSAPPADSLLILDGLGELSLEPPSADSPSGRLHFSSVYGTPPNPPDHWRTVTWALGARTFTTGDRPQPARRTIH